MILSHFFLNIRRKGVLIRDEEGDDVPDLDAARTIAINILREMQRLPHAYGRPREWRHNIFVITDESGAELAEVPYDALL